MKQILKNKILTIYINKLTTSDVFNTKVDKVRIMEKDSSNMDFKPVEEIFNRENESDENLKQKIEDKEQFLIKNRMVNSRKELLEYHKNNLEEVYELFNTTIINSIIIIKEKQDDGTYHSRGVVDLRDKEVEINREERVKNFRGRVLLKQLKVSDITGFNPKYIGNVSKAVKSGKTKNLYGVNIEAYIYSNIFKEELKVDYVDRFLTKYNNAINTDFYKGKRYDKELEEGKFEINMYTINGLESISGNFLILIRRKKGKTFLAVLNKIFSNAGYTENTSIRDALISEYFINLKQQLIHRGEKVDGVKELLINFSEEGVITKELTKILFNIFKLSSEKCIKEAQETEREMRRNINLNTEDGNLMDSLYKDEDGNVKGIEGNNAEALDNSLDVIESKIEERIIEEFTKNPEFSNIKNLRAILKISEEISSSFLREIEKKGGKEMLNSIIDVLKKFKKRKKEAIIEEKEYRKANIN